MTFELNVKTPADLSAEEQISRAAGVNRERDRRLAMGATVDVTGISPIPVQGRVADQINLMALGDTAKDLIAAGVTDPVIPFRDGDNVIHNITPEQVAEMARKGKEAASAIYAASWALKDSGHIPDDYEDDRHWP